MARLSERTRGGRSEGGAAVGFGAGAWPAEEDLLERVAGGFNKTSSSRLIVYHRRTVEAEKVWRWPTLLKKAGGGL